MKNIEPSLYSKNERPSSDNYSESQPTQSTDLQNSKLSEENHSNYLPDNDRRDDGGATTLPSALKQKIRGERYETTADNKPCILSIESLFKFLSLEEEEFIKMYTTDLDGNIDQLSKSEFAYAAANYLKENDVAAISLLPPLLKTRAENLMKGAYLDFSAINQLTKTEDTLHEKVKLNPELKKAILEQMPKNISKIKQAAYIYIKMCLILSYDDKVVAEDQFGIATMKHSDPDYVKQILPSNNKITCSEFNLIYAKMLHDELGLNFECDYKGFDEESYGLVHSRLKFRAGRFIVNADAVRDVIEGDLLRAKLGLSLEGFFCKSNNCMTLKEFQAAVTEMYNLVQQQEHGEISRQKPRSFNRDTLSMDFHDRKSILLEELQSTTLRGIDAIGYAIYLRRTLFNQDEIRNNSFIIILKRSITSDQEPNIEAGAIIALNEVGFSARPNDTDYYYLSSNYGLTRLTKKDVEENLKNGVLKSIKPFSLSNGIPGIDFRRRWRF